MTSYLTQSLDTALRDNPSAGILLAGDFNQLDLKSLCRRFNLKRLVDRPTRGNNTLDQILTNMATIYNAAVHLPPLGNSDHQCLLVKPKIQVKVKPILRKVRTMRPRNIAALTICLNEQNRNQELNARDVDQKVDIFTQHMTSILDETMPIRRIRKRPSDKPWLTPYIKSVIKDRQRAYSKGDWRNTNNYESKCHN